MMRKKRILIIDDDPDFVEATKLILERRFEVLTAYNADDGWRELEEGRPDLLILDMLIDKRGEGFLISRKMRKDPRLSHIPILMLTSMRQQTGYYFLKDDPRDKWLPVDEFVEKPIESNDMVEKVKGLLERRKI
jgi:DNA-binding response OmpR family regulator